VGAFVVDPNREVVAQRGVGGDLAVAAALARADDDCSFASGQLHVGQVQDNGFAQAQPGVEGQQRQDPVAGLSQRSTERSHWVLVLVSNARGACWGNSRRRAFGVPRPVRV
jgi:hypothetical protein